MNKIHPLPITKFARPVSCAALTIILALICTACSSPAPSENGSAASSQAVSSSEESSAQAQVSSEKNRNLKFEDIPANSLVTAADLHAMLEGDDAPFVVDIRAAGLAKDAFIEGSKNIPAGRQLDLRINEIPTDRTIVLVSQQTDRLAEARQTLIDAGFSPDGVLVVSDGMDAWIAASYPTDHREQMGC